MSQHAVFIDLIRISVLHILRASGFHAARPAALDTLVDLTARYLLTLAVKTAENANLTHDDGVPTITDIRIALQEVGALHPHLGEMEEQLSFDDDLRGVNAFTAWFKGDANKEIRRIAGLSGALTHVEFEAGVEREDFLTVLKKKHSKTGEESRFQGSFLGKDLDEHLVHVDGGGTESIKTWESLRRQTEDPHPALSHSELSDSSAISSPLSELEEEEK